VFPGRRRPQIQAFVPRSRHSTFAGRAGRVPDTRRILDGYGYNYDFVLAVRSQEGEACVRGYARGRVFGLSDPLLAGTTSLPIKAADRVPDCSDMNTDALAR
jgi:hypothetical protein